MVDAAPDTGGLKKSGKIKIPRVVEVLMLIIILGLTAYLIWNHYHSKNLSNSIATPAQVESMNGQQTDKLLSTKNYSAYQYQQQTLATEYMTSKDYNNAERVMNEILSNVPTDQINSSTYSVLFQIEKAKGNVDLEKKYLALMVTKLKSEGNNATAATAQQELDSLK